jgi:hypothetical protein
MFKVTAYNSCAMCGYYGVGRSMPAAYRQMLKKASKQFITYRACLYGDYSDLRGYDHVAQLYGRARILMGRGGTRTSCTDRDRVLTVEIERLS